MTIPSLGGRNRVGFETHTPDGGRSPNGIRFLEYFDQDGYVDTTILVELEIQLPMVVNLVLGGLISTQPLEYRHSTLTRL